MVLVDFKPENSYSSSTRKYETDSASTFSTHPVQLGWWSSKKGKVISLSFYVYLYFLKNIYLSYIILTVITFYFQYCQMNVPRFSPFILLQFLWKTSARWLYAIFPMLKCFDKFVWIGIQTCVNCLGFKHTQVCTFISSSSQLKLSWKIGPVVLAI